jgi:alpha-glucosidase
LPPDTDTVSWLLSNGTDPVADLALGLKRARAAALLMLALPGSAYLYQGEELGLEEVADIAPQYLQDPTWQRSEHHEKGRDGCRVPLPWESTGPSLGFGSSTAWIPQPAEWATLAWSVQEGDSASTLELYRSALKLRRELAGDLSLSWLHRSAGHFAFTRSSGLVCVVNFGSDQVHLPPMPVVLSSGELTATGDLPPDTAAWVLTN